jgi:hypothetical protein
VTVDTPRTQALVGFLGDASARTTHLSTNVNNPFCNVMVTKTVGYMETAERRRFLKSMAAMIGALARE